MKTALKIVFFVSLSSTIFATNYQYVAADQNCTTLPTVPAQCQCIMTNAVADCLADSPLKSVCTASTLDSLFKTNPNLAMIECQQYGGTPDQCRWSVTFYDQNNCTPTQS